MKRRIYKKWLKNPFNKRLIWKFCKPFDRIPVAYVYKEDGIIKSKTKYEKIIPTKKKDSHCLVQKTHLPVGDIK